MIKTQTGGGVVIGPNNMVLVVNQHGLAWSLPKGHIEREESAQEAAAREIEEESGITSLKLIKELGSYERYKISLTGGDDTSEKKHITMFLFTTEQTKLQPIDSDNPEAKWVEIKDVAKLLTHLKDKNFFVSIQEEVEKFILSLG